MALRVRQKGVFSGVGEEWGGASAAYFTYDLFDFGRTEYSMCKILKSVKEKKGVGINFSHFWMLLVPHKHARTYHDKYAVACVDLKTLILILSLLDC